MDKIRSLYLECLRISAALYVFLYHMGMGVLGKELYFTSGSFSKYFGFNDASAHYFVIIFFVLSGYLITMSVLRPNVTFTSFLIARLGRLYSVLIPSLIFSYLVVLILVMINTISLENVPNTDHFFARIILNLLFLTQTWSWFSVPPFNTPFWSVNYEFIYYMFIAGFLLLKNKITKVILIGLLLAISWPKIILLFPSWLVGSLLYFIGKNKLMKKNVAFMFFIISLIYLIAAICYPYLIPLTKDVGNHTLFGFSLWLSYNYIADFLFALVIGFNIYCLFSISTAISNLFPTKSLDNIYNFIRKLGNCSYTLYMFHTPLLYLFVSITPYNKYNVFHQMALIFLVLASVYFIAKQTEWKVDFWRSLVSKIVNFFTKSKFIKTQFTQA